MSFMCNSCFVFMERGQMAGEACFLTSCFHIFCNPCSRRIRNDECLICGKQCQVMAIGKDMPMALKAYFEPPLSKLEKLQQQYRFMQQQQEITWKLKTVYEEAKKKREVQIKKILNMERQVKVEEQRLEKVVKEKMAAYRKIKEEYQRISAEEEHIRKCFKEHGWPVDKNISADSGMHSFEKSV